jgi:mono/diheme cytochrome c family protein
MTQALFGQAARQGAAMLCLASCLGLGLGGSAHAQTVSIARGQDLVTRNCAVCHAVGLDDASLNVSAPPFRDLHQRFPLDDLEAGILSDLIAGHPPMPEFRLTPSEVHDLVAYLRSLGTDKPANAAARLP